MKDRIKNTGILVKQMKNIAISETYIPLVEDFSTNVRALSQSTTSDTRWIGFLTIWQTITCKKRRHKCTKTLHLACARIPLFGVILFIVLNAKSLSRVSLYRNGLFEEFCCSPKNVLKIFVRDPVFDEIFRKQKNIVF